MDCPLLTYRDKEGGKNESDCFPCPAKYWCNHTGMTGYIGYDCPIGHYCPSGHAPEWCPAGRMKNDTGDGKGAGSPNDCDLCTGGYYCPFGTMNYTGIPCRPRTYCPVGSPLELRCIGGYYCSGVTTTPTPCPAGFYCRNASESPVQCEYPYYCPAKSVSPRLCPLGYKPLKMGKNRTAVERDCQICPAGYYSDDPKKENCTVCPPGYYCPAGTKGAHDNVCPKGHYCPEGVGDKVLIILQ